MGAFGTMSLAEKLGIVIGCLVVVTFAAGFLKLWMNKRRTKKSIQTAEMTKSTDREKLVQREKKLEEGDLFGVRAIENGYFGGVAQSVRSGRTSPTPSYKLAPGTTLVDWSKTKPGSSSSSLVDYPTSRNGSVSSIPASLSQGKKQKPSPLRLHPSDAEVRKEAASAGGIGGTYMPPLPSPRTARSVTPFTDSGTKPEGWVNPLDVHFSRPSTPTTRPSTPMTTTDPTSYLPRLNFPSDVSHSTLVVSSPAGSGKAPKSEQASIISTEEQRPAPGWLPPAAKLEAPRAPSPALSNKSTTLPGWLVGAEAEPLRSSSTKVCVPVSEWKPPSAVDVQRAPSTAVVGWKPKSTAAAVEPPKTSPTFSIFPSLPSRAARQSGRSIFPASDDSARPPSRRSPKKSEFDFGIKPVPLENLPPQLPKVDPIQFPQDTRKWGPGSPIIRDSIVSKQRVSVYQPALPHSEPQQANTIQEVNAANARDRTHSIAASSIYSIRTSLDHQNEPEPPMPSSTTHVRSASNDTTRSRSTHKRSSSSQSLSRTQDSLRRHSRKPSQESTKRRSRQRDQLHFDPTSAPAARTRAGSVQGRKVDFDHPRESPFGDEKEIRGSGHSASSSSSSLSERKVAKEEIPSVPRLNVGPQDPHRLSAMIPGRNRSASEASQGSIGDFYDAYYRQSIMAQRASVVAKEHAIAREYNKSSGLLIPGNGKGRDGRRHVPQPLKLGPGSIGGRGLARDTIMELPSPASSLGAVGGKGERFPKMALI